MDVPPVPWPRLEPGKLTPVDCETDHTMAKLERRRISKCTVDGFSVQNKNDLLWDRELKSFEVRVFTYGATVYIVQSRSRGESTWVTLSPYAPQLQKIARAVHERPLKLRC